MIPEENETEFVLEILRESFPGRSDKQLIPIGMAYTGTRWGRDHRFCEIPDLEGKPLLVCNNESEAEVYFEWLADHLYHLESEPNEEQTLLCTLVKGMLPQDACLLLGMNAALYQLEVEPMEIHIQESHSFEQYLKEEKELMTDEELEDLDEEQQRQLYQQVTDEMVEWLEVAPGIGHVDLAWRAPLSAALKKVEKKEERIDMLNIFYGCFFQYIEGLDENEEQ